MMVKHPDVGVVILAAGRGTRMNNEELPKVLIKLFDRPLLSHLLGCVRVCGAAWPPTVIIGHQGERVIEILGRDLNYVWQDHPLGTGHAVRSCQPTLNGRFEHILVLYGDHPYVPADAIDKLITEHKNQQADLSLMTATATSFDGWQRAFLRYGRIVRNDRGQIVKIVEYKDATQPEREIKEVNPAYFCFRSRWLWPHLTLLRNNNVQKEYYLTDLLGLAIEEGAKVVSIEIDPASALGVNTEEDLERAELVLKNKLL